MHDEFLAYLSEKGRGTWAELRDGWDWLGPDDDPASRAWIVAQSLSALGHIEVSWDPHGIEWCAAPPVITMIPRSGGRALVTGARTQELYLPGAKGDTGASGRLLDEVNALELWLDEFQHVRSVTTLMVACDSPADAQNLAERLGITFNFSVAAQLAAMLPPLAQYQKLWVPGTLPQGFEFERFETGTLTWRAAEDANAHALYRARSYAQYVHALHAPWGWMRVSRDHAIYEVLRWEERSILSYDAKTEELAVPFHAPLPGLQARAATLCSGLLPKAGDWSGQHGTVFSWIYSNVDREAADRIASSLCQSLDLDDE